MKLATEQSAPSHGFAKHSEMNTQLDPAAISQGQGGSKHRCLLGEARLQTLHEGLPDPGTTRGLFSINWGPWVIGKGP